MPLVRSAVLTNGVAVDVVDGPMAAATECLHWTSFTESMLNLVLIGLATLIVAVAVVPVDASPHRFGPGR